MEERGTWEGIVDHEEERDDGQERREQDLDPIREVVLAGQD